MTFRTEIDIAPFPFGIDHSTHLFTIGSCFAERVTERLRRAKFRVESSPTGILFNPASIASTLTAYAEGAEPDATLLVERDGEWVSMMSHSILSRKSREEALSALEEAYAEGGRALREADVVIVTLGTAYVYALPDGRVVANCHKQPQSRFVRRMLSVEEIVALFEPLLCGALRDKQVIFTVSPVRHIGDGLADNSLSKATLRVAVDRVCRAFDNVHYFPAYECVMDDLRDYRFYASDMVHPSEQAVEYVWDKFVRCALSESAQRLLPQVQRVVAAAAHRPKNPDSKEFADFCRHNLALIERMREVDFSKEEGYFSAKINIFARN